MFLFWLTVVGGLILLLVFPKLIQRRRTVRLLKNVPCGPTLPILGHAHHYISQTEILNLLMDGLQRLGPVYRLTGFWKEAILVSDPKYLELVLGQTKMLHKSEDYDKLHTWLGTGLLTAGPEKWKHTRKIITPTFHFQILEDFIDVFNSCSDILITKLKEATEKSSNVNISDYVTLCTLDVICETAMGTKVNAQMESDSEYVSCIKEMSRIITERIYSPKTFPPFFYFSKDYKLQEKSTRTLHAFTESVIRRRRQEIAGLHQDAGEIRKKRLAFLDLLINSSIDGRPLTDEEIRQEVDTFMFEGHDTTSSAISSVFYCLAFDQDAQSKVYEEVAGILGGGENKQQFTFGDLQNMRYLEMVIKETLRLYPPVPLYGRNAHEDIQIGDLLVPKGVGLGVFAWGLHRNPALYPDPEKFDPERFTLENQNSRNPYDYLPFSAGPRNCVGQRFAMLELKSMIAKVLRNFEVLPMRDFRPLWVPAMVLKSSNGVQVRLKKRESV